MKAIILAAGRGSRMGNTTSEHPKCLTSLSGKELLDWQLEALRGAGIEQIGIVRGYMAEKIMKFGCHYFENCRWSETNMVMSLCCAEEWLIKDECIVSYSDIVYPTDTITQISTTEGDIVICYNTEWLKLWEKRFIDPLSDAETFQVDQNGILLEIGGKANSIDEIKGQYMGLLKFSPKGWEIVRKKIDEISMEKLQKLDVTTLLKELINSKVIIKTVPIKGKWLEIDSESDLKLHEKKFAKDGEPYI